MAASKTPLQLGCTAICWRTSISCCHLNLQMLRHSACSRLKSNTVSSELVYMMLTCLTGNICHSCFRYFNHRFKHNNFSNELKWDVFRDKGQIKNRGLKVDTWKNWKIDSVRPATQSINVFFIYFKYYMWQHLWGQRRKNPHFAPHPCFVPGFPIEVSSSSISIRSGSVTHKLEVKVWKTLI